MNFITRFAKRVKAAATEPTSYAAHLKEPLSRGFGYLYWLVFCASLFTAVALALTWIMSGNGMTQHAIATLEQGLPDAYPRDLVVTISGGVLSTNAKEPLAIDPPFLVSLFHKTTDGTKGPAHFMVIDTSATAEQYPKYDTMVLVTKTSVIAPDKNNSLRIFLLSELKNPNPLVLNHVKYTYLISKVMPFIRLIPLVVDLGVLCLIIAWPFMGAAFAWVGYLIYLSFFTLFVWIISALYGRTLNYGQLYTLGLYGLTWSIGYTFLVHWVTSFSFPLLFTLLFLGWMTVVLRALKSPTKRVSKAKSTR